jgi:hypothetical protein
MSRYSAEEKAESTRRARALLERLDARLYSADEDVASADDRRAARNLAYEPAPEDALSRWKREALELEATRDRERIQTAAELNAQRTRDWEAWADARIAAALVERDRGLVETRSAESFRRFAFSCEENSPSR